MHSLLGEILTEKQKEIAALRKMGIPRNRDEELLPLRDFRGALSTPDKFNMICEIKFASPSAGIIREKTDPVSLGRIYEEAGAAAISLVTDHQFFGGDLSFLPRLRKAVSLPILRKDFIVDAIQVRESFSWGADAVLLIVRILPTQRLKQLFAVCQELGMAVLTEVHDPRDLKRALKCGADIVGINNRNLEDFRVDLSTTLRLAPLVPAGHVIVSESGINGREDMKRLKAAKVHAVLVGTSLMKSKDIGKKARELAEA